MLPSNTPKAAPLSYFETHGQRNQEKTSISKSVLIRRETPLLTEIIPAKNPVGSNSCFINVIIQMLYHSKSLRVFIMNWRQPKARLLSHLKESFTKYKTLTSLPSSRDSSLSIDFQTMRKELSDVFPNYSIGSSGDPIDVFLNIMTAFHASAIQAKDLSEDNSKICEPKCASHLFYSLKLQEAIKCQKCKKETQNVYDNNYYVYEAYIWEILNQIKEKTFKEFNQKLFLHIKEANCNYDNFVKFCKCNDISKIIKTIILRDSPVYIMIHLTWDIMNPPSSDICNVYTMIPLAAKNDDLFTLTKGSNPQYYDLNGIITFYNGHYTCSFRSEVENKWFFCDDLIIKEFATFTLLMNHLVKNHYHPIAICYKKMTGADQQEHINQKDYETLYKTCLKNDNEKGNLFQMTNKDESTNSLNSFSIFRQKSGMFNRHSSSNQDLIQGGKIKCLKCGEATTSSLIRCERCGKEIMRFPSNNQIDSDKNVLKQIELKGTQVSIPLNSDKEVTGNFKNNKMIRLDNNEGFKTEIINYDDDNNGQNRLFGKTSSNEAEGSQNNENRRGFIDKKDSKEITLNFETAQDFILGNSPVKMKPQEKKHKDKDNDNGIIMMQMCNETEGSI